MARRAGKEPIINNQVQVQIINLKKQLLDRIRDLELRGIVDGHLRLCHSLKEENGLLFFVRSLSSFCIDASAVIEKMVAVVNQTFVDFKDLSEFCFKLEGSAGSVGAFRVSKACLNLRLAIDMRSKHGCLLALNEIKYEFDALRTPLETIIQLDCSNEISSEWRTRIIRSHFHVLPVHLIQSFKN